MSAAMVSHPGASRGDSCAAAWLLAVLGLPLFYAACLGAASALSWAITGSGWGSIAVWVVGIYATFFFYLGRFAANRLWPTGATFPLAPKIAAVTLTAIVGLSATILIAEPRYLGLRSAVPLLLSAMACAAAAGTPPRLIGMLLIVAGRPAAARRASPRSALPQRSVPRFGDGPV